jgi:hypothetical protein
VLALMIPRQIGREIEVFQLCLAIALSHHVALIARPALEPENVVHRKVDYLLDGLGARGLIVWVEPALSNKVVRERGV